MTVCGHANKAYAKKDFNIDDLVVRRKGAPGSEEGKADPSCSTLQSDSETTFVTSVAGSMF